MRTSSDRWDPSSVSRLCTIFLLNPSPTSPSISPFVEIHEGCSRKQENTAASDPLSTCRSAGLIAQQVPQAFFSSCPNRQVVSEDRRLSLLSIVTDIGSTRLTQRFPRF
ncbi:unnamed protein product [Caenorhabditis auriculariae]|uniref:Uncharacterized protein n=1 Tax=Caenorhabditis auriculariae TaxID=2777116 RepID=A0A8S1HV03_9PELO|nr:unnamed protein product [Caenorhabditis auriculariae]